MKKFITGSVMATLILVFLLVSGCTGGVNINFGSPFNGIEKKGTESTTLEIQSAEKFEVINQTGNISVEKTNGGSVKVKLEKKVRGQVDEEIRKVLDEMKISAAYENGTCVIKLVTSDGTTDFWKWQQRNYPMLNVNADLTVELPQDFANYSASLVTGNIDMKDLSGEFSVRDTTGNVTLTNLAMSGSNQVKLITGNITISSDISDADGLRVDNITGNVTLSLPGDSNAKFNVSLTTGNIGGSLLGQNSTALGGTTVKRTLGDGKTEVDVENITGNITLDKK